MGIFGIPAAVAAGLAIATAMLGLVAFAWSFMAPRGWRYYIAILLAHASIGLVVLITWWSSTVVYDDVKILLGFFVILVEIPVSCYIVSVAREAIEENE